MSSEDGEVRPTYPIGSVDSALRLLRMFGERKTVRISEASTEIGVARSTAHRLMQMLLYHDFVAQEPGSKAYVAGRELVRVGLAVVRDFSIRTIARPVMERVAKELGETTHLTEMRGAHAFFLDSVESPRTVRAASRIGMSLPGYATASGKVLLAELASEELHALLPKERLDPLTERTITSRKALLDELVLVRERGYATNFGESESDVSAAAVPIRDSLGVLRAVLSISTPVNRLSESQVPDAVALLQEAAQEIGNGLPT